MQPGNYLSIESLNEQWRDKDSVMLHACFQLLKDVIEKENLLNVTDWNVDKRYQLAKKEITELYNWWLSYEESIVPENADYSKQNEMLHRLIDIRWVLWT